MPSLNYHHLLYFWMVAKEGTIARAAEVLDLAQPTISGQVKALEAALGERLFARSGRTLKLTEAGELVFRYADEIFGLGREMMAALQGRPTGQPHRLMVGISDAVPKVITHRILSPALEMSPPINLVCKEMPPEQLITELTTQALDLVLSDQPVSGMTDIKTYNHLLGETTISFFAPPGLLEPPAGVFPQLLEATPFLMPAAGSPLRRSLEVWFERHGVRPRVVGEFEDSALMKEFGRNGAGVFPGPSAVENVIMQEQGVHVVGRTREITERFYAITAERRVEPPALPVIIETARARIF
jgi:LysR family transcriptional activator of nhaA